MPRNERVRRAGRGGHNRRREGDSFPRKPVRSTAARRTLEPRRGGNQRRYYEDRRRADAQALSQESLIAVETIHRCVYAVDNRALDRVHGAVDARVE